VQQYSRKVEDEVDTPVCIGATKNHIVWQKSLILPELQSGHS